MKSADVNQSIHKLGRDLLRFRVLIFVVIVALLYCFLSWRINVLANVEPDAGAVASKTSPARPNIDQETLRKIKQLQDNSVNVRSLFSQARQNPFQE